MRRASQRSGCLPAWYSPLCSTVSSGPRCGWASHQPQRWPVHRFFESIATVFPFGRATIPAVLEGTAWEIATTSRFRSTNKNESEIAMMSSWWILWMVFMFLFLVSPVSYGWGYRGWGPPYPRYIQRRRGLRASATGQAADPRHQSWGWGGDFVWVVLLVAGGWAFAGLFLR